MAARTLYPAQETVSLSEAKWSLADDNAQDQVKPAAGQGDTVIFTENSGSMLVDEAPATVAGWNMAGDGDYAGTLGIGAYTIDVDGDAILAGTITSTSGSFDVTDDLTVITATSFPLTATINFLTAQSVQSVLDANEVSLGPVVNSAVGAVGSQLKPGSGEDLAMVSFQQDTADSTYEGVSTGPDIEIKTITLTGTGDPATGADLLLPAGNADNLEVIQAASGDIKAASGAEPDHLTCAAAGFTSSLAANTRVHKLTLGAGTFAAASRILTIVLGGHQNDNFFTQDPGNTFTSTGSWLALLSHDNISNGAINVPRELQIRGLDAKTLTMMGDITLEGGGTYYDLYVAGNAGTEHGTLDLNGNNLSCQNVYPGYKGTAGREGTVKFGSGYHTITGNISESHTNDTLSEIHLEDCTIALGGTFDGSKINSCTNASAKINGGTVSNVDCSSTWALIAYGSTDGTGNSNVLFGSPGGFFWRMAGPMTGPMAEAA